MRGAYASRRARARDCAQPRVASAQTFVLASMRHAASDSFARCALTYSAVFDAREGDVERAVASC
jgi:hypothetical protein